MGRLGKGTAGVALAIALTSGPAFATPSPLARYVDHARVLVVSAAAQGDPDLARQDAALRAQADGLEARDVTVVRAVGAGGDACALRRAVRLPAGRFGVALVGKDGGVKLSRQAPVAMADLFKTIDAMPMRR